MPQRSRFIRRRHGLTTLIRISLLSAPLCIASAQHSSHSAASATATRALVSPSGTACQPSWIPTFGGVVGTDNSIEVMEVFDDGGGPALYAGGSFSLAGGAPAKHIAKWDGSNWSPLGSGFLPEPASVQALAVFDDGSGPALYAGGAFASAGGVDASNIAKWNGSSWSAVGGGINGYVSALTVFDDGSGPALYAGGQFTTAGGGPASNIAKWDGSTWSALGSGVSGPLQLYVVRALASFDDGSGSALYAGGVFTTAGGVPASNIAKWDGSSWSALGRGVEDFPFCLCVFDDGGGPALYVGGHFPAADGVTVNGIAKWNGSAWSTFPGGVLGGFQSVAALSVFDDGSGPALFAGGGFTHVGGVAANGIAKWNGSGWAPLGTGLNSVCVALLPFDDGSGPALFAGGAFSSAGGVVVNNVAKWNGSSWSLLGHGMTGPVNLSVNALSVFDDGGGSRLYAGGSFVSAGGLTANNVARWDGSSWSPLGTGLMGAVFALTVFDDGSGPALYAGGTGSGSTANRVAKWNGVAWTALGGGMNSSVTALAVFDDGGGPKLYAGGWFTHADGAAASRIAKWNGSNWTRLDSGLDVFVSSMVVFDDGSGPALYVGGNFTTAGGVPAAHIARWNGSSWSPLANGTNESVQALTVFDDGSGPALFVGGAFSSAGGVASNFIAKWDGSSWSETSPGLDNTVSVLTSFDDGRGPALYAGGPDPLVFGVPASRVAKWDGASWSALGSGMNNSVSALRVFDDGGGTALYAGGSFTNVIDSTDSYVAKWGNSPGCGMPGTSFCDPGVAGVIACPCGNAPANLGLGCNNSSNTGGAQLSAAGIARISYDTVLFATSGEKPTATSIVLQGDAATTNGLVFGQGVRCVAGSLKRMYVKTAVGGSITAPQGSDLPVHVRSAALGDTIAPGTHRYYGVYYRDPTVLGGCPASSTFNITQQLDVLWSN